MMEICWPKALLFDLDGTLVDSVPDLAFSVNQVLEQNRHEALEEDQVRTMIGNGVKKLVQRAFEARGVLLEGDELEEQTTSMMEVYAQHLTDNTTKMAGADALIDQAHAAGVKIAVVTNKPVGFSREIIERMGWKDKVQSIVGGDSGPTRKPEPGMLHFALQQMGVNNLEAIMVGDSPADILAAINSEMKSIAIRGGYTNIPVEELGADVVLDSLSDVPNSLRSLVETARNG